MSHKLKHIKKKWNNNEVIPWFMSFFIAQVNVIQMISKSRISTVQAKCVQNQTDISSSIHVHTNVSVDMNKCISRHEQMYQ
jgi:hypothetical protein